MRAVRRWNLMYGSVTLSVHVSNLAERLASTCSRRAGLTQRGGSRNWYALHQEMCCLKLRTCTQRSWARIAKFSKALTWSSGKERSVLKSQRGVTSSVIVMSANTLLNTAVLACRLTPSWGRTALENRRSPSAWWDTLTTKSPKAQVST